MSILPDQSARNAALDISRSFIVQAPAGSGKTELLTLRFMKLLAACEEPEQVLAITFTRKAASEMRDRIINALNWCQHCLNSDVEPKGQIQQLRFDIAKTVLEKAEKQQWRLLENPSRLRVQTIDSFCFYLAKQLPILSQVGGDPQLAENIDHCFAEAVSNTLALLESTDEAADDIELLLTHLDNNVPQTETLLSNLLKQRNQWINHIFKLGVPGQESDEDLAVNIRELIAESLQQARDLLVEDEQELVAICNFAAENLQRDQILDIADCQPLEALPGTRLEDMAYWKLMLSCLLTSDIKSPTWRKRLTSKEGFPAKSVGDNEFKALNAERKLQLTQLLAKYSSNTCLLESLNYLRLLPANDMSGGEWHFLSALFRILRLLNGELYLALRKYNLVDYIQVSASALLALGDEEQPTDIALALDNVIHHILVDEFQDTSFLQRKLLDSLTRGWEANDGRSLFLVGDAMQSCYGFRNANVGIYLNVWEQGIDNVALETLRLSSNFRSQGNIVSWVNEVFQQAFPDQIDVSRGAVPYSRAEAIHEPVDDQRVDVCVLDYPEEAREIAVFAEAELVLERVQQLRQLYPDDSIAILVRNRGLLTEVVPQLRDAGLNWTASDIDRLNSLPLINDLCSLTRIVVNPGDRLAWLALLRAPWCGLDVGDLHLLANHDAATDSLWPTLQQHQSIQGLSGHAQASLHDFVAIMEFILTMRFRNSLRKSVEAAWSLLRGLNCCPSELDQESVERFFLLLEEHEVAGGLADIVQFEEKVDEAFIPSPSLETQQSGLFLMTMHKAKGLEYDHVILPGLNRGGRSDEKSLLIWHERVNHAGDNRLFMAALTEAGADDGPLYQLIRHEQKLKDDLESTRLLYIAVTRAMKTATLFASIQRGSDDAPGQPRSNSLLQKIWKQVQGKPGFQLVPIEECNAYQLYSTETNSEQVSAGNTTLIRRFSQAIGLQEQELQSMTQQMQALLNDEETEQSIPGDHTALQSLTGTLIHRCLEIYVQTSDQEEFLDRLESQKQYWKLQLRHLNLEQDQLETCLSFIETSVRQTVSNENLAWLFDHGLEDSQCELALTRQKSGYLQNSVVDRTFVDSEGSRWIIDYKTGMPGSAESVEVFIEQQKRVHETQLKKYCRLFADLENRPIRSAILFTALPLLVEFNQSQSSGSTA